MQREFTASDLSRFWAKVDRREPDACWLWQAARFDSGYGAFRHGPSQRRAHRVSYELAHGPIPEGLSVCHSCDTPACVNPAHLWVGTDADNHADRNRKGRQANGDRQGLRLHPESRRFGETNPSRLHPERLPRGERHGRARLTLELVHAIRAAEGSDTEIASKFGVSRGAVYAVRTRRTWKHVFTRRP